MFGNNRKEREQPTVDASSMADIAFLLLVFFLVATAIVKDQGMRQILPKWADESEPVVQEDRNVFKVLVNSKDMLLVEDEPMDISNLREECKKFLTNNGRDKDYSVSPKAAIVSFKADRGTSYESYLMILDQLKAAYYELRADALDMTVAEYLKLNKDIDEDKVILKEAIGYYPMNLSIAEPTDRGSL